MLTPSAMQKLTAGVMAAQPFRSILILDGKRHEGCRGSASSARQYRPEGYGPNFRLSWMGNAREFDERKLPAIGKLCTVDGQSLELANIPEIAPCGTLIRLDFRTPGATG